MPIAAKAHTTTALTAASRAGKALDGVIAPQEIPADLQLTMHKRALASQAAGELATVTPPKVAVIPETPQQRFKKWIDLDDLLKTGGVIEDATLTRWYGTYPQSPEHASMMRRHKDAAASGAQIAAVTALR